MKKKIFMFTLVACLVILSIAGSSLAYFTDVKDATTTFTAGNVYIDLTVTNPGENLFPGQTYTNTATIKNTGTENAYVGAIITITGTDIGTVLSTSSDADKIPVAIQELFVGLGADGYTVKYVAETNSYKVYVVKTDAIAANAEANLFTQINIPAQWNNAEMKTFVDANISVVAYAVQEEGFADAVTALKTAFANSGWENYPAN